MKIRHLALAVTLALGVSNVAMAQETSSAIRGNIVSPAGQSVANARVEIVHVPSGTRSVATTNESGTFSSTGLRVGGPYTVTISSSEGSKTYENIYLSLGDSFRLNAQLESVERIAITGSAPVLVNNAGSSSYFSADDIANAPSFNRDIKDIVRNNPLAVVSGTNNELSVAGVNPRFNSISIDGISQNDDFGLNSNGYPTTRSPISIEAIEQITIDSSPFKAKDSGFQGAKINAVTKSGSNKLSGSLFYENQNDGWAGTPKNRGVKVPLEFDETTYGGTLGGAVVKDKLFFFVSYDYYEADTPIAWGPAGSGAPNETNASSEDFLAVQRIARDVYGVDAGGWDLSPVTEDEKLLIKLDWNISDSHRAAFTYQYTEGNRTANMSSNRNELRLSSHWYNRTEELNNYAFKLYSDWTPDFSTQLSLTYQDNPTTQASLGDFGDVLIRTGSGDIAIGSDYSRHSNVLNKKTYIFALDGSYLLDEHQLSFGYQFKRLDIFNMFVQRTKGEYVFNSLADFEAQQAYSLRYRNANSLNPADAAAEFVRDEHALYIHDEWAVSDTLTLDIGLRYERLGSSDKPVFNQQSFDRTGYDNTENLDGIDILLPRLGFKWEATDDLIVRGGIGRFSGGQPTVWISNGYSNPGVGQGEFNINTGTTGANASLVPALSGIDIKDVPQAFKDAVASSNAYASTNFTDPNFKLPSDWRFQLAYDYRFDVPVLGENFLWTTEYMYRKDENSAAWVDASLIGHEIGTTSDGQRIIYDRAASGGSTNDLMLTNASDDGRAHIITTMLNKAWQNGISATFSYAHQDVEDAYTGTSSTATSNYGYNTTINRNEATVGRSAFETKHRFVFTLGYETELFEGYKTNVNMFFERRSGKPITYYAYGSNSLGYPSPYDLLSPGSTNHALLPYIPTYDDANVEWTSQENKDNFFQTIEELGLSGYQGGYLPRGVKSTPWVTTLDLSLRQEIPGFVEGHRGLFYVTVDNFLNLIDSSKGKVYGSDFGTMSLVDFTINPTTKNHVYGGSTSNHNNWDKFYQEESTWRIKVGVSYRF